MAMFTTDELDAMRDTVALVFVDEATVTRTTGEPEFDATNGGYTPSVATLYEGPCKIRLAPRVGRDVEVGETEVRAAAFNGHFPVDTDIEVNDVVVVTASATDEALVARRLRVTDVAFGSWQLERVVVLELIT